MRMISFGTYTFPGEQADFSTNFADVVPATTRLPGLSGGFDELGDAPAPSEIGKVSLGFTIQADTTSEMEAKRDLVKAMAGWGALPLWAQPSDPAAAPRYCRARVNSIQMPERLDEHTDLWQRCTVYFQASDPRWYVPNNSGALTWGAGNWGAKKWGGSQAPYAISGLSTDKTITTLGSAQTRARLLISCGAGQTVTNPTIERIVNGVAIDQVVYTGVLAAYDWLEINPLAYRVRKNGSSAYNSFTFLHPDWLRLLPGANTIRIRFGNVSDAATVSITYDEAYY